jgi:multidrug transporter EmrE-like cation transporter
LTTYFAYLLIASLFQVCWLYNVKSIDRNKLALIRLNNIGQKKSLLALLPLLLYFVFGISNVVFFTLAMDKINPSTAYAIWTGVVLSIASLIDKFYFGQKIKFIQYAFLLMIIAGIVGLKFATHN